MDRDVFIYLYINIDDTFKKINNSNDEINIHSLSIWLVYLLFCFLHTTLLSIFLYRFPRTHVEEFPWGLSVGQELLGSEMHRSLVSLHMQRFSLFLIWVTFCFGSWDALCGFNLHFPNCTWRSVSSCICWPVCRFPFCEMSAFSSSLFSTAQSSTFSLTCLIKMFSFRKGQNSTVNFSIST